MSDSGNLFSVIYDRDREWRDSDAGADATYLYRYFDADQQLLYVGITTEPLLRHKAHQTAPWAKFATTMSVDRYPYRRIAEAAEFRAIDIEAPFFNNKSNWSGPPFPPHMRWFAEQAGETLAGEFPVWADCSDWFDPQCADPTTCGVADGKTAEIGTNRFNALRRDGKTERTG